MTVIPPKTETKQLLSSDFMQEIFADTLKKIKQTGATDAGISISNDSGFSIDVRQAEVENIAFNNDSNLSIVVYFDKRKGSASTNDLRPQAILNAINAACAIAKASDPDECFGLAEDSYDPKTATDLDLYHPWQISLQDAIELAKNCEASALSLDKRIVNSDGVSISTEDYAYGFVDTLGHHGYVKSSRHSISCSLMAEIKNLSAQRDGDYSTARNAKNLAGIAVIAGNAVARTVNRLGAKKIKTGKMPVIYSNLVSRSLFACFMQAISGSQLYRKRSFLLDSLGKKIFPDWLKIFEEPYLKGALGSASFDGDGIATRNNVFVESGCVANYALDTYSARKMGLKTTANADGVHNLKISHNVNSLDQLMKTMNNGLLVTELIGSGVNLLTGDYSRGACGFWVENGKIIHPVEEITIAGNLHDIYKNIVAIANDYDQNVATRCGSILIDNLVVAGS